MSETADDRRSRRAQAMFRTCQAHRRWADADDRERQYWLTAAHAVEASDAAAGMLAMPLDRPFGQRRNADIRGLGVHAPTLAAMYEQAGVDVRSPQRSGAAESPEIESLDQSEGRSTLLAAVRSVLAMVLFIACAAGLLAIGYYLATAG